MNWYLIGAVGLGVVAISSPPGQRTVRTVTHKAKKLVSAKPSTSSKYLPAELEAFRGPIERSSVANGVPFHLVAALILTESSGRVSARAVNRVPEWIMGNKKLDGARQSGWTDQDLSNAHGLTQIQGATAWDIGFRGSVSSLYDPARNIETGMRILRRYHSRFKAGPDLDGWRYSLMAYNGGPNAAIARSPAVVLYATKILDLAEKMQKKEDA